MREEQNINSIELAKQFVPVLDEVYKSASLTSDLDGAAELARQGANANELIIPMLDMQGLGDYCQCVLVSTFVVSLSDPMEQYRRKAGVLFRRVRRSAAIAETASDFRPVRQERNGRG